MNRQTAEKFFHEVRQIQDAFNPPLITAREEIVDMAEKKALVDKLMEINWKIWTDIVEPIIKEYPELDPHKEP